MIIETEHPYTKRSKTVTEWCICKKSEYVSEIYELLRGLRGIYLPLEKINDSLFLNSKSLNLLIVTDFITFCLHIKSVIIKYRFRERPPLIYCCKGFNILRKFGVQQDDGSKPSLSDLNKYDLVVFTLDTKEKNAQLSTCINQVVYNRHNIRKPTWVYLPKEVSLENTQEYTPELKKTFVQYYKFLVIPSEGKNSEVDSVQTESQNSSSNFSPFNQSKGKNITEDSD